MHPYFHCSIIHCGQDMETTRVFSIEDWIKGVVHIYTMEYYSAIRKDKILSSVTTWINPENIMLSEISQIEKA